MASETIEGGCEWTQILDQGANRCEFVKLNCEGESIVNFYHIYYCTLNENKFYFIPLAVRNIALFHLSVGIFNVCELLCPWLNSGRIPLPSASQHRETFEILSIISNIF